MVRIVSEPVQPPLRSVVGQSARQQAGQVLYQAVFCIDIHGCVSFSPGFCSVGPNKCLDLEVRPRTRGRVCFKPLAEFRKEACSSGWTALHAPGPHAIKLDTSPVPDADFRDSQADVLFSTASQARRR